MHVRRWEALPFAFALGLALALATLPSHARADREHLVREGQTLSEIARRYGVSVSALMAANRLGASSTLRAGQTLRVPERGVAYVREGQTLSHIARANGVSVQELARLNRIRPDGTVRVGQRLVLPGFEAAQEAEQAERRWGAPRHPGIATFIRVATREQIRLRLVDDGGRVRNAARRRLARVLRHRGTDGERLPHPRLLQLLARVSDHFGGRTIYVVSGYRPARGFTREASRHVHGHAVDFRIQGVPNTVLRDYCRTLGNVGVGYYPNSTFVHLDVRDEPGYWVDLSRPGEAPQYRRRGEPGEGGAHDAGEGGELAEVADDGSEPEGIVDEDPEDLGSPGEYLR